MSRQDQTKLNTPEDGIVKDECSGPPDLVRPTRRQFLFAGAALAVGTNRFPSLVEEFTSLLESKPEDLQPEMGESLRPDLPPVRREAAPAPTLVDQELLFLTFDDGPLPCTGRILDLLAETNHKATFFVIGRNLTNPKLRDFSVRALREGHDIGNHSFSHPDFSRISAKRAQKEIVETHALIQEVVEEAGVLPERQNRFFRFPYGVGGSWSNHAVCCEVLASLNYDIAWWDVDTMDWRMEMPWFPRSPRKILASLNKARPRDVVLLHDRSKTAHHLPQMVALLGHHKLVSAPLSRYGLEEAVASRQAQNQCPPSTTSGPPHEREGQDCWMDLIEAPLRGLKRPIVP